MSYSYEMHQTLDTVSDNFCQTRAVLSRTQNIFFLRITWQELENNWSKTPCFVGSDHFTISALLFRIFCFRTWNPSFYQAVIINHWHINPCQGPGITQKYVYCSNWIAKSCLRQQNKNQIGTILPFTLVLPSCATFICNILSKYKTGTWKCLSAHRIKEEQCPIEWWRPNSNHESEQESNNSGSARSMLHNKIT